jgi:hypothetical protein
MNPNNNPGDFPDRQEARITDMFEKGLDRVCELFTVQIENVKQGIDGVNDRLDTVNGRLYKHEGRISALEGREYRPASKKTKIAAGAVGGVSVLAVLHSLFEMVRSIGPGLVEMVRHSK